MRFLADESCDFVVVRALRTAGHDVLAVSEFQQRSVDRELIALAHDERRILLTEDKDFGWLVFVGRAQSPGVILVRFPSNARGTLGSAVTRLVEERGAELLGTFAVLLPSAVRISRPPAG